MPLKAVLFDLDNTLFDRDRAFRRWADDFIHATLGLRDIEHREEARDLLVALDARGYGPKPAMFATLKERYPTLGEPVEALAEAFYRRMPAFAVLDDDAAQLLDALRRAGIPFGIVTNGTRHQHAMVEALGLDRRASCVFVSETFGARKPETAIFLAAAAALDVEPRDVLFVGDNPEADIGARIARACVPHGCGEDRSGRPHSRARASTSRLTPWATSRTSSSHNGAALFNNGAGCALRL